MLLIVQQGGGSLYCQPSVCVHSTMCNAIIDISVVDNYLALKAPGTYTTHKKAVCRGVVLLQDVDVAYAAMDFIPCTLP